MIQEIHANMVNEEIRKITEKLIDTLNPLEIRLFGSYANNTFNEDSDFDIYIIVPDEAGDIIDLSTKAYASLRGVQQSRPVDIVINHKSNFYKRIQLPTLEKIVQEEGYLLYAS